uniref:Uncharacterized protein n=1 Tax=Heterorhabditis bacteriophora TaxID=37862 RepID=A0A1I7WQA4_HETBA
MIIASVLGLLRLIIHLHFKILIDTLLDKNDFYIFKLRMIRLHLLLVWILACSAIDDLYIIIDEISVYNCRGVKNEIKITEDDVSIVNEKNNKVYYIHAPGNYSLHFKRIKVEKNFGFLAGEIGVTLQVPIIEGPAVTDKSAINLPYWHTFLYSRYCDLCGVSQRVESELNNGVHQYRMTKCECRSVKQRHVQFLPTNPGDSPGLDEKCGNIAADEYDFKKTISLPNRSTLENLIKSKITGVDDEIKKRLNKGCKCCSTRDPSCGSLSYLYCNIEDCKSGWALQCLHNTAKIAACYTVEFNYSIFVIKLIPSYSNQMFVINSYGQNCI